MLHLELLPLDDVVLQVFIFRAFREVDEEATFVASHLDRSAPEFNKQSSPELKAIELFSTSEGRHSTEHSVVHAFAHEAVDVVGHPNPIDVGQQWDRCCGQLAKWNWFAAALNHVKDILVEHIRGNEVVLNTKSPFVVPLDISIKGAKLFGRLVLNSPMSVIPRHHVGSGSRSRP